MINTFDDFCKNTYWFSWSVINILFTYFLFIYYSSSPLALITFLVVFFLRLEKIQLNFWNKNNIKPLAFLSYGVTFFPVKTVGDWILLVWNHRLDGTETVEELRNPAWAVISRATISRKHFVFKMLVLPCSCESNACCAARRNTKVCIGPLTNTGESAITQPSSLS